MGLQQYDLISFWKSSVIKRAILQVLASAQFVFNQSQSGIFVTVTMVTVHIVGQGGGNRLYAFLDTQCSCCILSAELHL